MHIVRHSMLMDLAARNLFDVLHPGLFFCEAASRMSLNLLGQGGLSGLDGGGAHDSTPHNSTQGRVEQRSAAHRLLLSSI
jgi:hypothetical protein